MLLECVPLKWEQDEERGLRDRNDQRDLRERVDVHEGQRNQVDPDVYVIQDGPRDRENQGYRENQGDQERSVQDEEYPKYKFLLR